MELDLDQITDKLFAQAYEQAWNSALKPIDITSKGTKKEQVVESSTVQPIVTAAPNPVSAGIPLQQTQRPQEFAYRPRMPRAEREAMEQAEYKQKRDDANNDILMKGLGTAAVLGTIGILGRKQIGRGSELAKQYLDQVETGRSTLGRDYLKQRPSFFDHRFWLNHLPDAGQKADHAARLKEIYSNPLKLAGAAAYRLGVDNATDASRMYGWRYNHPIAGLSDITRGLIDPMDSLNLPNKAGVGFAAMGTGLAVGGLAYDITNPSELFRPKGFKQLNPNPEDPRESTEPVAEVFQRLAMGRNARPLKFAEAKKDIPGLDIDRYRNYMDFTYKDKGPGGLGAIKWTDENLHGNPEIRMMGYPIDIPTVTTAVGGAIGSRLATTAMEKNYRRDMLPRVEQAIDVKPEGSKFKFNQKHYNEMTGQMETLRVFADKKEQLPNPKDPNVMKLYLGERTPQRHRRQLIGAMGGVAAGAAAGALLGQFVNSVIANSKNNPEALPDTQEYGIA